MKIQDLLENAGYEDFWDDEVVVPDGMEDDFDSEDEAPGDPEKDSIPHLIMQLKKAADVEGNYPIKFEDGSEHKLPFEDIVSFIMMYMEVKPDAKELMQTKGIKSKENFDKIVEFFRESQDNLNEESKKDACYHKVKSRYKVWPSAYASGALVQCRKVGAKNWGNKSKK